MREKGVVVEVRGGTALVRFERGAACGECRACGAGAVPGFTVEAWSAAGAAPGARVIVECSETAAVRNAFMIFVMPVAALVGGYLAGWRLAGSEGAGIALGAACVLLIYGGLHLYDRRVRRRGGEKPRIVRMIGDAHGKCYAGGGNGREAE